MARIRHDIATPTLGQNADAETQPWHPVLDTYARGVEFMRALPMDNPQSWLWAATRLGSPWALRRGRRGPSAATPRSSSLVSTHDGDWDSVPDRSRPSA
jgi:hypothetical protein